MKKLLIGFLLFMMSLSFLSACTNTEVPMIPPNDSTVPPIVSDVDDFTINTKITDVINNEIFEDYGRLIFPVNSGYYSGNTLGDLRLTWYNNINPTHTVEIVNFMKNQVLNGNQIFYDIYTDEEKAADPRKNDTGLFFF